MAGFSNYIETAVLDSVFNGVAFPTITAVYAKLHLGDPGEDCTSNPAVNTTRLLVQWNDAELLSGVGRVTLLSTVSWTNVPAQEDYSHLSFWDHLTVGNPLGSGLLSQPAVMSVGDDFYLTDFIFTLD